MDAELAARWARILEVRERVLAALEEARQGGKIGKPLESKVTLAVPDELYDLLAPYGGVLPAVMIVSQLALERSGSGEVSVSVEPPLGEKCARCWLVLQSVGSNADQPQLCERCVAAIGEQT